MMEKTEEVCAKKLGKDLVNKKRALFVDEKVWKARKAGLLPMLEIAGVNSLTEEIKSGFDKITPTFTDEKEFKKALTYFGLSGKFKRYAYIGYKNKILHVRFMLANFSQRNFDIELDKNFFGWKEKMNADILKMQRDYGIRIFNINIPKKFPCRFLIVEEIYDIKEIKKMAEIIKEIIKEKDYVRIIKMFNLLKIKG